MPKVLDHPSHSLKEFRILPGHTAADGSAPNVSLETRLCRSGERFIHLHTPFVSAAMQAVTGTEMAVAAAQLGSIGILPVSQTIAEQCAKIHQVKRFKAGFQTNIRTVAPEQSIGAVTDIIHETGYTTFPVTDSGRFQGKLLGIITDKDFDVRRDRERKVRERMKTDVQTGVDLSDLKEANDLMIKYGRGVLPIVSADGILQSVVFKKDLDKHLMHPNESIDAQKRLLVGAAVSTHPEDRDRARALVECEADALVIDASDGHTEYQRQMLQWIKGNFEVPVVGGNVVTAAGFRFLVEAGADAVKVGMGIGSGCTTQEVKSTGRGQATALLEIGRARDELARAEGRYVPPDRRRRHQQPGRDVGGPGPGRRHPDAGQFLRPLHRERGQPGAQRRRRDRQGVLDGRQRQGAQLPPLRPAQEPLFRGRHHRLRPPHGLHLREAAGGAADPQRHPGHRRLPQHRRAPPPSGARNAVFHRPAGQPGPRHGAGQHRPAHPLMKIGYTTWGMPDLPIDAALEHLARLGFTGVEPTVIPGYDPLAAAALTFRILEETFARAGIPR